MSEQFKNELAGLVNIANGAAPAHFLRQFNGAVMENIFDGKTSECETREITLKIKVKPKINPDAGEKRMNRIVGFNFQVESSCKLAKMISGAHDTHSDIDDEGRPMAVMSDPSQVNMLEQMSKLNQTQTTQKTEES